MTEFSAELLDVLACPACRNKLAYDYEGVELVCTNAQCGLAFPIQDGVPVLKVDDARRSR